jgi:hypothetical protein
MAYPDDMMVALEETGRGIAAALEKQRLNENKVFTVDGETYPDRVTGQVTAHPPQRRDTATRW